MRSSVHPKSDHTNLQWERNGIGFPMMQISIVINTNETNQTTPADHTKTPKPNPKILTIPISDPSKKFDSQTDMVERESERDYTKGDDH